MSSTVKNAIVSGAFFAIGMSIIFGIIYGLTSGIYGIVMALVGGIIAGILFGLIIGIFTWIASKKFKKVRNEMSKTETILFDGGANHFVKAESVGGWLFLTDKELIFKSHNFNVQNHEAHIPLPEIAEVIKKSSLHIFPNGLWVKTKGGKIEKFVVNDRAKWVNIINEQIQKINTI